MAFRLHFGQIQVMEIAQNTIEVYKKVSKYHSSEIEAGTGVPFLMHNFKGIKNFPFKIIKKLITLSG